MATTDTQRETIHTVPCNILLFPGNIRSNSGFMKIHNATETAAFGYSLGVWHSLCPGTRAIFANSRGRGAANHIQTPPAFVCTLPYLRRGIDPRSHGKVHPGHDSSTSSPRLQYTRSTAKRRAAFTTLDSYAGGCACSLPSPTLATRRLCDIPISLGEVVPLLTMGKGIGVGGGKCMGTLLAEPLLPIHNRRRPCISQYKWGLH